MTNLFKVCDQVRCVNDREAWLDDNMSDDQILQVVDDRYGSQGAEIYVGNVNEWPEDFILYSRPKVDVAAVASMSVSPFRLQLTSDGRHVAGIGVGLIGETSERETMMSLSRDVNSQLLVRADKFITGPSNLTEPGKGIQLVEGVITATGAVITSEESARIDDGNDLGVYRPNLEDRKVGKVRVELVDDGFPLALREIAKVMTWAQTAKGYKDHDWQSLPNAELSLAAAASRHRTDHIRQRVVDALPINECVDHESLILHKAHEAFGVLAQLELMLRGSIR